jgi:hypothetical protein
MLPVGSPPVPMEMLAERGSGLAGIPERGQGRVGDRAGDVAVVAGRLEPVRVEDGADLGRCDLASEDLRALVVPRELDVPVADLGQPREHLLEAVRDAGGVGRGRDPVADAEEDDAAPADGDAGPVGHCPLASGVPSATAPAAAEEERGIGAADRPQPPVAHVLPAQAQPGRSDDQHRRGQVVGELELCAHELRVPLWGPERYGVVGRVAPVREQRHLDRVSAPLGGLEEPSSWSSSACAGGLANDVRSAPVSR